MRKSRGRGVGTKKALASAVIIPRVDSSDRPARASLSSRLTCATFKASASAAVVRADGSDGHGDGALEFDQVGAGGFVVE